MAPNADNGDLTKEEVAIKELRAKVQDVLTENQMFDDDLYLLQWLKVHKLSVSKAEKMIRNSAKWRKENKYETLADEDFTSEEKKHFIVYLDENIVSKEGIPVILINFGGATDMLGFVEKYGKDKYLRWSAKMNMKMERLMINYNKKMRKENEKITSSSATGILAINNVINYSAKQSKSLNVIRAQIEGMNLMQNYFPPIMSHGYLINMNKFFSVVFKLLKPMLESVNLTMDVFGPDEEEWKAAISKRIDLRTVRADFGGSVPI